MGDEDFYWKSDSFLSDFLSETNDAEVDNSCEIDIESSDLDSPQAFDVCLSNYLSGEDGRCNPENTACSTPTTTSARNVQKGISVFPLSVLEDFSQNPKHVVLAIDKPQRHKSRGNSDSRQAVAARENRQKKKQYVSGLQAQVEKLSMENDALRSRDTEQQQQITQLQEEVAYFKNVIANESALSAVLRNIHTTEGVKFSVSATLSDFSRKCQMDQPLSSHIHTRLGKLPDQNCTVSSNVANVDELEQSSNQGAANRSCLPLELSCLKRKAGSMSPAGSDLKKSRESKAHNNLYEKHAKGSEYLKAADCDGGLGGICLHVLGNSVSVELCSTCNLKATGMKSRTTDHTYCDVT